MCNATQQAPFGQGSRPYEPVMHHCTMERGHSGSHHDSHTGYSW